jgi:hypothetical protein
MTASAKRVRIRGGPLAMLALLIGGWCGARAMWWEYPFAPVPALAASGARAPPWSGDAIPWGLPQRQAAVAYAGEAVMFVRAEMDAGWVIAPRPAPISARPGGAVPPVRLGLVAPWQLPSGSGNPRLALSGSDAAAPPASAPFLPPARALPAAAKQGRWSLDGWAFWRQGSSAAPISQGRVPVYGASQTGAVLHYRIAPSSRHDPRLYARAYRALVPQGENEGALGVSLRPLARVPLRLAGEVRYTDAVFFNAFRPAGYAVTEIAPMRLPFGAVGEIYAQTGWVGGPGATPFADAQASVTRELPWAARLTDDRLRMSFGAGAWGGAQKDAQRADIGPTLRLDTRIGKVPARVSVDWRLRVAGDAAPGSGVAVTVATGF